MTPTSDVALRRISALTYALACVALHADDDDKTEVIDVLLEEIQRATHRLERQLAQHHRVPDRRAKKSPLTLVEKTPHATSQE